MGAVQDAVVAAGETYKVPPAATHCVTHCAPTPILARPPGCGTQPSRVPLVLLEALQPVPGHASPPLSHEHVVWPEALGGAAWLCRAGFSQAVDNGMLAADSRIACLGFLDLDGSPAPGSGPVEFLTHMPSCCRC